MILLKANPKLKNVFEKLIKAMNVMVTWTDVFVIVNNNLILAGDVRSLIFSFDSRKIYTNIMEIPTGSKQIDSMPSDGMLENVINMTLYSFGKWGSINSLKVDRDYASLNTLFEGVLHPVNIEPDFSADSFRFYKDGIQITYEDTILDILKLLRSEGKLKEGQNLITSDAKEDKNEGPENDSAEENTSEQKKRNSYDFDDDESESEIGLWHNLTWKKETCVFDKQTGSEDDSAKSRIGHDFYITDNQCPKCKEKLYMAMYPSGKELLIDTEEGRVFMARTYTCHNCHSFYTPRPKRLLQEGDVYSLKFDEDKTAYEDYLSVLGKTAERTANYKFNEFETERNAGKAGYTEADSVYINEFNRGASNDGERNRNQGAETADAENLDVQHAWGQIQAERARAARVKAKQERAERERLEQERLARVRAEEERLERERQERLARERAEEERLEQERQERLARERAELERQEREKMERERLERERIARERADRERLEQEIAERERIERESLERLKAEQERRERERIEREQAELERIEREKAEQERRERERIEREKAERERLERERIEREKAEQERIERERIERENAERERAEREEAERIRKEQEKLAIRQNILRLSGKTTDELRAILSNLERKNESRTDEETKNTEESNYMLAVRETLRTKMNAKYVARMGTLGNLSYKQLSDLKNQIEGEEVLYNNEKEEYLKEIETYMHKAEAAILDQKVELSKNKSYAELEQIIEDIEKRGYPDEVKQDALSKLYEIKADRAKLEVENLIAHIPLHLDRKQLSAYLEKIDRYKEVDLTPYRDRLDEKANMAEEEEISAMMKRGGKKDRTALWNLYEELKARDYKEENKAPYLEKIYDKIREMDEAQIDIICPSIARLTFDDGLKVYEQIEQGMFLPEIKVDALEMIKRRLTKLKTDESVQLMRKLKHDIEEKLPGCDGFYFYDAREELKKSQNSSRPEMQYSVQDDETENMRENEHEDESRRQGAKNREAMMNAIDGYAAVRDTYEYPLMVCDTSRAHNGKDGFVITPDHIFFHTFFNSGRINVADIEEVQTNKGLFGKGIYVKCFDGSKEKLPNNLKRENQDAFAEILNDFVKYLQEKPESRSLEYMAQESHDVKCCYRCGHVYKEGNVCPKCGYRMNK